MQKIQAQSLKGIYVPNWIPSSIWFLLEWGA